MSDPVVVLGAAGGIGRACTRRLASEGRRVIGLDRVSWKDSHLTQHYEVDLQNEMDVDSLARILSDTHRDLWGLVYCAGIYPIVSLQEYNESLWDAVHSVNVKGAFLSIRALEPSLVAGGRIVLVSSAAAFIGSRDVGYAASKAGLTGLTRGLALALAQRPILVNAIAPGLIDTPMSQNMSEQHQAEHIEAIPLRRAGLPDEVAVAVSFLLAEDNSYMTGAVVHVDGGLPTG